MDYLDIDDADALVVAPDANPVDFLMALYRDVRQPMTRRLRAAIECAPYVHSTFRATAIIQGGDFAQRLERAIVRSKGNLKVIDARPIDEGAAKVQTDCRLPPTSVDKRLRRL
jgi:hypothetical protein